MRRGLPLEVQFLPTGLGAEHRDVLVSPPCTFPAQQLSPQCGGQVFILEETAPCPPTLLPTATRLILSCTQGPAYAVSLHRMAPFQGAPMPCTGGGWEQKTHSSTPAQSSQYPHVSSQVIYCLQFPHHSRLASSERPEQKQRTLLAFLRPMHLSG